MKLDVDVGFHRNGFALEATFTASEGQTIALLGPNGAGKSTLVRVLAGLLRPHRGHVTLGDRTLFDAATGFQLPPAERPIGVLFQDRVLFPHLNALENVAFPLRARGMSRRASRDTARGFLAVCDAEDLVSARPETMSGGQAQRVALARALVGSPRLLLLDEPFAGLDVSARTSTRALLRRRLTSFPGIAIVVTHDPVDAMTLASQLVLIEDGRVTQSGTPSEIRSAPRTTYAADLVGVNIFRGELVAGDDVAEIVTPAGRVTCVPPPEIVPPVPDIIGILRPAEVSLYLARPVGSARNVFEGAVRFLSIEGDRARVGLDTAPPLVAEVTTASLRRLGLTEGVTVWASFKALEVRVVVP